MPQVPVLIQPAPGRHSRNRLEKQLLEGQLILGIIEKLPDKGALVGGAGVVLLRALLLLALATPLLGAVALRAIHVISRTAIIPHTCLCKTGTA